MIGSRASVRREAQTRQTCLPRGTIQVPMIEDSRCIIYFSSAKARRRIRRAQLSDMPACQGH
jgi:hypothetical protein